MPKLMEMSVSVRKGFMYFRPRENCRPSSWFSDYLTSSSCSWRSSAAPSRQHTLHRLPDVRRATIGTTPQPPTPWGPTSRCKWVELPLATTTNSAQTHPAVKIKPIWMSWSKIFFLTYFSNKKPDFFIIVICAMQMVERAARGSGPSSKARS